MLVSVDRLGVLVEISKKYFDIDIVSKNIQRSLHLLSLMYITQEMLLYNVLRVLHHNV